jgi:mxaC protein
MPWLMFETPLWLLLLPLALWPLWASAADLLVNTWAASLARDRASDALQWLLRIAGVTAIAALVLGLAGPYRPQAQIERIGRGAEIVLVLDRSRSMDQGFARTAVAPRGTGPEAIDFYARLRSSERESKGRVARQLLSEFASKRPQDRFGMIVFSSMPMRVLGFTQKQPVIQAAIAAGDIGRGLSETNIALALQSALALFDDRPYTGSRLLLLVSDGGDRIEPDARERITQLARKHRVAIYWIYIRSTNSPGLMQGAARAPTEAETDSVPELFLHRFFQSTGLPYRAYEADNSDALQKAMADVNRLENQPIVYFDTVPRRDLGSLAYGAALAAVLLLLAAQWARIRRWA